MPALEYVVRPYQSPNANGTIIIPSTPSGSREQATLKWGTQCTIPEVSGENFQVVCCKDQLTELDRNSERIRVYQNGDPTSDNWVDLMRAKTMDLKKNEKNSCGDNWDDISGVAQQIDSILSGFASYFNQVTGNPDKNCAELWTFKPQASQAGSAP
jgi:hypothetical protein